MDGAEEAAFDAWAGAQMKERRARDRAAGPQMKKRREFLHELVKEALADPRTDGPTGLRLRAYQRYDASGVDTCVWCGVDPPRGRTLLCQTCNVYRRDQGRPPTEKAVDRRRDERVEAGAEANRS